MYGSVRQRSLSIVLGTPMTLTSLPIEKLHIVIIFNAVSMGVISSDIEESTDI